MANKFNLDTSGAIETGYAPHLPGMHGVTLWRDLDAFTQGYIEAAFFTEEDALRHPDTGPGVGEGPYGFALLAPETLAAMIADCAKFQPAYRAIVDDPGLAAQAEIEEAWSLPGDDSAAGRDFWYTRNGHGCGFWDGDWPTPYDMRLTEAAKAFGEVSLHLGDDGKIYA